VEGGHAIGVGAIGKVHIGIGGGQRIVDRGKQDAITIDLESSHGTGLDILVIDGQFGFGIAGTRSFYDGLELQLLHTSAGAHKGLDQPVVGKGGGQSGQSGPGSLEIHHVAFAFNMGTAVATGRIAALSVYFEADVDVAGAGNRDWGIEHRDVPGIDDGSGDYLRGYQGTGIGG